MAGVEDSFKISLEQEIHDVFYYQQIAHQKSELVHKVPWGGAIVRNCLPNGEILHFKTLKEYEVFKKETNKQFWLLLPLKIFRHENTLFGVYCCPQCATMTGTNKLSVDQDPRNILSRLCIHSRVCSTILDDWRNIWEIDISASDRVVNVVCNKNIQYHNFHKQVAGQSLLAAVRTKGEVAVLCTVTNRQTIPLCSVCVTKKCPHVFFYNKEKENEDRQFSSRVRGTSDLSDLSDEDEAESHEADPNNIGVERGKHANYWVNTFDTILSPLYNCLFCRTCCHLMNIKNAMDITLSPFLFQLRTTRNSKPSGFVGYMAIMIFRKVWCLIMLKG